MLFVRSSSSLVRCDSSAADPLRYGAGVVQHALRKVDRACQAPEARGSGDKMQATVGRDCEFGWGPSGRPGPRLTIGVVHAVFWGA